MQGSVLPGCAEHTEAAAAATTHTLTLSVHSITQSICLLADLLAFVLCRFFLSLGQRRCHVV